MTRFLRSLPWILIGALVAWDGLRFLPVPEDPGPEFQGVLEPPSMVLQGGAVIALLAALALWKLWKVYHR